MKPGNHGRDQQTASNRLHPGGLLPRLTCQRRPSKEGKWEMEDVRGLHEPIQGLPKRQLYLAKYRLAGGFHNMTKAPHFHRRILMV